MRRNTCRSDFVRCQAKTCKQPRVAYCGQGDAAVRQIASMNDSYGYTIVNCVWPHYSSISNSQLTQADDVFVHTSGRSRSMYFVDYLDPYLPFWGAVRGVYISDPTQAACPKACSMCGSDPATRARSHTSGIYLPWKSYLVRWESIIICPACEVYQLTYSTIVLLYCTAVLQLLLPLQLLLLLLLLLLYTATANTPAIILLLLLLLIPYYCYCCYYYYYYYY